MTADMITGSLGSSLDGDTPRIDIVSSSNQRGSQRLEVSTVGGGTIRLTTTDDNRDSTHRRINHYEHTGGN